MDFPGRRDDRRRDRSTGRPVLVHLLLSPFDDEFRAVLQRYGDLLDALLLLFPKQAARLIGRFQVAFRSELATPLSPGTLDELRWYFEAGPSHRREPHELASRSAFSCAWRHGALD